MDEIMKVTAEQARWALKKLTSPWPLIDDEWSLIDYQILDAYITQTEAAIARLTAEVAREGDAEAHEKPPMSDSVTDEESVPNVDWYEHPTKIRP